MQVLAHADVELARELPLCERHRNLLPLLFHVCQTLTALRSVGRNWISQRHAKREGPWAKPLVPSLLCGTADSLDRLSITHRPRDGPSPCLPPRDLRPSEPTLLPARCSAHLWGTAMSSTRFPLSGW